MMAETISTIRMLDAGMKASCMTAPTAPLRLLTLAMFAFLGCASAAVAAPSCLDFSATPFTIKIYNNAANYNIFPVVVTATNGPDEWLQGGFQVPTANIPKRTYGHAYTYRFYIKPAVGIAYGGSVTLSLPLCTQVVGSPGDGSTKDEWIDWWNGGRILIFANPATNSKQPPAALSAKLAADQNNGAVTLYTPCPACTAGCNELHRPVYKSMTSFASNYPYQLTEYTLADVIKGPNNWDLNIANVDYDISYVDDAYLPVAMGPVGNPDVGWIGSISGVNKFRGINGTSGLMQFLTAQPGWPRYLDPITQQPYLRLPGTYNAFAEWNPLSTTIITQPGQAIQNLRNQWTQCTTASDNSTLCQDIIAVQGLFVANYTNYLSFVAQGSCNPPPPPLPPTPALDDILKRVYGWVPWNENCSAGAGANALADTPGYNTPIVENPPRNPPRTQADIVHSTYISLQYLPPLGTFNPYVNLVHGPTYLDMPGSYAFSIDDRVGNIHIPGTGFVLTVAGPNGLDNMVQYDPNKKVVVILGDPVPTMAPAWNKFTRCDVPTTDVTSGRDMPITSANYPCDVVVTDAKNRPYTFTLASPPYMSAVNPISACTAPDMTRCTGVNWQTIKDPNNDQNINSVSFPPPPQ
jgi:hypothetical protein